MDKKQLTVKDFIVMPEFQANIANCLNELIMTRKRYELEGLKFKRGPLERLKEMGALNTHRLVYLYIDVLDKTIDTNQYTVVLRSFIKGLCDEALHRTIEQLNNSENK